MIKWPEPAFRLRWSGAKGRYSVDAPNIDSCDCYTEAQLKQAVRDALKRAAELARTKMSGLGAEAAIRAIIKEI